MTITLISAANPRYLNAEGTAITLDCEFSHLPGEIHPFCAMPIDVEAHGREVYARAVAGEFGQITPYVAPPPVIPKVVTMRQAKLALLQQGLLASVNSVIEQAGEAEKIEWQYATEVKRDNSLVQAIASQLSITKQQLDDLFVLAKSL
jgi:hypothetical protein